MIPVTCNMLPVGLNTSLLSSVVCKHISLVYRSLPDCAAELDLNQACDVTPRHGHGFAGEGQPTMNSRESNTAMLTAWDFVTRDQREPSALRHVYWHSFQSFLCSCCIILPSESVSDTSVQPNNLKQCDNLSKFSLKATTLMSKAGLLNKTTAGDL